MSGNPFIRLEAACANAVERGFALAFPSALEPVQIARKLVAAFEAGTRVGLRNGRRFSVRLHPNDYARLKHDLPYLEDQWRGMLARLADRSHEPQRQPEVVSLADVTVVAGTVAIAIEALAAPQTLVLRVRRGVPGDTVLRLERSFTIGRDGSCDFVLVDPSVSRRHLKVVIDGEIRFEDLASSNGTLLNGVRVATGSLACGDVLGLGDSELVVDAERSGNGDR